MSKSRHQSDRNCRSHPSSSGLDHTFSSTSSSDLCHHLDNLDEEDEGEEETGLADASLSLHQQPPQQKGMEGVKKKELKGSWSSRTFRSSDLSGNSSSSHIYQVDSDCADDLLFHDDHGGGGGGGSDEDFSVDLPSDLPSGLVDAEGDLIGSVRLGQEDDGDELRSRDSNVFLDKDGQPEDNKLRSLSVISNGRVFTHGRGYHLHNHCRHIHHHHGHGHGGVGRDNSTGAQSNSSTTITQHYYPEGGFGWVILVTSALAHVIMCGVQFSTGVIMAAICKQFESDEVRVEAGWLGACSVGCSLFLSPLWVSICKRKSTRLTAVFGGLVAALGCLFTSFATQLHQIFFSYAIILGVGVGLTRDASSLMVGQYFKRKRDMVEIIVVAASGLGILVMSILINGAINSLGWRLGLQVITGCLFICFFLGTCYRSASLYHPQRRAILHLKNQKRKVKDKEKRDDKPPFLDCSCLRSKTVQILLLSSALTAFGTYTPIFYLAMEQGEENPDVDVSLLYLYVGLAWILGSVLFGILVIQKSKDCRMSKQYLCQAAGLLCGISIVTFTIVKGQSGLLIFCCIYGFSLGGYNYSLKVYTYDRVRARHFPRAWSFIQSSQGIPLFLGVPITGYVNDSFPGWRAGYYLSALTVVLGSSCLFLADVRKRRLSRRKSQNSSTKTCETTVTAPDNDKDGSHRLSFIFPHQPDSSREDGGEGEEDEEEGGREEEDSDDMVEGLDPSVLVKELTCISEEAFADMDFQDIYYEEWDDFFGEDESEISSCNKVEDCLVSDWQPDCPIPTILRQNPRVTKKNKNLLLQSDLRGGGNRRKHVNFSRNGLHAGMGTAAALARGVASMGTRLPLTIQEAPDESEPFQSPLTLPPPSQPSISQTGTGQVAVTDSAL